MLDALLETEPVPQRVVEVGWAIDVEKGGVIYAAPRRLGRTPSASEHTKALNRCPAINDFDARHFEIPCPFDLNIAFVPPQDGQPAALRNASGGESAIRGQQLGRLISLIRPEEWRDPKRPIVQLQTPYLLLSDEPCWLNQLPPFMSYRRTPLPGLMLGGRFPIHIWPRHLMWAFEWHDTAQNIVFKRGEPLFYMRFECNDASRHVRLVETEMTPAVREYVDSVSTVTNYVNQTFSLFETAQQRRPGRLLAPKTGR